jgi:hypothetical protein
MQEPVALLGTALDLPEGLESAERLFDIVR